MDINAYRTGAETDGGTMASFEDNSTKRSGAAGSAAYSHAYIVWGGSADGRARQANKLAMAMICEGRGDKPCGSCVHCEKALRGIHPDIITYEHDQKSRTIYVDQIRALREDAVIMPNEAAKKVYINQSRRIYEHIRSKRAFKSAGGAARRRQLYPVG